MREDNSQMNEQDIPVFSVPENNREFCFHHQTEPSAGTCVSCNKFMCDECFDALGVIKGEEMCYDCAKNQISESIEELIENKAFIRKKFNVTKIGIFIGSLIAIFIAFSNGISLESFIFAFLGIVLFGGFGGVFLDIFPIYLTISLNFTLELMKMLFGFKFNPVRIISLSIKCVSLQLKAVYNTISNLIFYVKYLKETDGFIEADRNTLRQLEEFMEFTKIRNSNPREDIETLLSQNSHLMKNMFAQMARDKSQSNIVNVVKSAIVTVNKHGEIIRTFEKTKNNIVTSL